MNLMIMNQPMFGMGLWQVAKQEESGPLSIDRFVKIRTTVVVSKVGLKLKNPLRL